MIISLAVLQIVLHEEVGEDHHETFTVVVVDIEVCACQGRLILTCSPIPV